MNKKKIILGFGILVLLAILILVASVKANATDYYFDATNGNNANSGSQASPKRSIDGVGGFNSIFAGLADGDRVFFKRGEIFFGSLNINNSGSSGAPITIGNYGSGALPIITGLKTITGWTVVPNTSNTIWESGQFTELPSSLKVVLINGVLYSIGRWPDQSNWKVGVYRTINSYVANASITDNALPSSPNWTNATAVVHSSRWTIDAARITSITNSGHTLNLDYDAAVGMFYNLCGGTGGPLCNGYFIQNHASTLTKFGEWYHNPTTDKIKIYFGATNPSSVAVQASTFQNLLTASSRSYITVDGLAFKGANQNCINISGGTNNIIKNCEISYTGQDGINASGSNLLIDNNDILYSYNDGIRINDATNATTTNNFINYTFFAAGMGVSGTGQGNGIANGDNSLVQWNTILNSGFIGARVGQSPNTGNSSRILNNFIDTCLFVVDDGGGIYDYVGHSTSGPEYINKSQRIIGNIVLGMVGAAEGVKGSVNYKPATGIYMDDNSNGFEITGNVIGGGPGFGLFLHNATNGTVTANTVYNNGNTADFSQVIYKHDGLGWAVKNITSTGNVFFSRTSTQYTAQYIGTTTSDMRWFNNYYARPISENTNHIKFNSTNLTLTQWKNQSFRPDQNSTVTWPSPITSTTETRLVYNETKVDKTIPLSGTYKDIQGNTFVCSVTLTPFTGKVLIKTSPTTCSGNIPPTVSITSPANNATFAAPTSIPFTATASDADGTITKVEFYNGSTLIHTETTAPYEFTWANVAIGTYTITAKAYDNLGLITTSSAITVTVTNPSPTVAITSPTNGASFIAPATVAITATASDANGTVSSVAFYNGATLLGTDNTSPYSFTWNSVAAGSYSLNARATDNLGAVTTSTAIGITVSVAGNISPTVSITAPANNATYTAPATVVIDATASDADGTIANVGFYNGATLLNTDNASPYTYTWNSVAAGSYTITARATDNGGAVTTSTSITVIVNSAANISPTVSITSPANDATFTPAPASIPFVADADDADGTIDRVEFYNGSTLFQTEQNAPWEFTWTNVPIGNYSITARAYDNGGAFTISSPISLTVTGAGNVSPTVSLTSPANGASYVAPATVSIAATASDADGTVSSVAFYNGGTLLSTDNSSPYSFSWTNVPAGTYFLTAVATDNLGATTTSSSRTITVTNPSPTVSITSPANNATYTALATITINATASDADGTVTSVGFYNGATLLSTDNSSPYSFTWNSVAAGTYILTAKATDNLGAVTTSSAITITVTNPPLTVSITAPANNATYIAPASVAITATASGGTIISVDFYNGTTLLGTDNSSPYAFTWNSVPVGTYFLTAKATDNLGTVSTSSPITITVTNPSPTVSITSPANNATFTSPATVSITATASDANGTVSSVAFYNSENLLGTDNSSPYSFSWTSVPAGTYFLTAIATDNLGATTTSSTINITITDPINLPPTNVSITSPADNATFVTPVTVPITATATDPDGSISSITFYNGGTLISTDNTSPFTASLTITTGGTYTLTATATDNSGAFTTSSPITIVVSTPSQVYPVVNITSPLFNATYTAPANIVINADATDQDGTISNVKFYNGATLLNTDNNAPYTFTWSNVAIGSYSLTAKATDNNGNETISAAISISVTNALPVVTITSPTHNSSFLPSATINFEATATDANGTISNVKFYDGSTLLITETTAPYQFTMGGFAPGSSHTITAVATDNLGATTTSTPSTFTISANPTPTVNITAPTEGQAFTSHTNVVLTATATDDGTVSNVKFYNGATLLNIDNTAPYTFTWNDVSVGTKSISATATDNLGAIGTSNPVSITVNNISPTVSITSPANGASFVAPGSIAITATASDANGSVSKVDFYNGGVLIGTDNSSPYAFTWTGVPTGAYDLTALATDNDGDTTRSTTISVTSTNTPPEISLTATIISATPWLVQLEATATDANGSITTVDFYEGSTLITTEVEYPFEYTVIPAGSGSYTFSVVATDNDGATTTSNEVTVVLEAPTVSITSVTVTEQVTPGVVDIAATAADDVSVAQVDFYANGILIGTDLTAPYTLSWTGVANGVYLISAVATDNDGATTATPDEPPIEILAGSVSITDLNHVYDGTPKYVTVTVTGDYPYDLLYSDDPNPPTQAGSYSAVATINDGVHFGNATETMVIEKADPGLTWEEPEAITYLDELSTLELDAEADVQGTFDYSVELGEVLGGGVQTLSVIFTPDDLTNYNIDTFTVNLVVNKAPVTVTITSAPSFVYDGTAKIATATVSPNVGTITITYNGSLIPPSAVGIYTISVILQDDNYEAELVSGTMEITPTQIPGPTETRNFLLLNRSKIVNLP